MTCLSCNKKVSRVNTSFQRTSTPPVPSQLPAFATTLTKTWMVQKQVKYSEVNITKERRNLESAYGIVTDSKNSKSNAKKK